MFKGFWSIAVLWVLFRGGHLGEHGRGGSPLGARNGALPQGIWPLKCLQRIGLPLPGKPLSRLPESERWENSSQVASTVYSTTTTTTTIPYQAHIQPTDKNSWTRFRNRPWSIPPSITHSPRGPFLKNTHTKKQNKKNLTGGGRKDKKPLQPILPSIHSPRSTSWRCGTPSRSQKQRGLIEWLLNTPHGEKGGAWVNGWTPPKSPNQSNQSNQPTNLDFVCLSVRLLVKGEGRKEKRTRSEGKIHPSNDDGGKSHGLSLMTEWMMNWRCGHWTIVSVRDDFSPAVSSRGGVEISKYSTLVPGPANVHPHPGRA